MEAQRLAAARANAVMGLGRALPNGEALKNVVASMTEPFYLVGAPAAGDAALRESLNAAVEAVEAEAADVASPFNGRLLRAGRAVACACVNAGAAARSARRASPDAAPFALDVLLRARTGPYAAPLEFRLVFDRRWPAAPPKIRCATHALSWIFTGVALADVETDPNTGRRCGVAFARYLLAAHCRVAGTAVVEEFTLRATLEALADALEPGAHPFFSIPATLHGQRRGIIDAFAEIRRTAPGTLLGEPDAVNADRAFRCDAVGRCCAAGGCLPADALAAPLRRALEEAERRRCEGGGNADADAVLRAACERLGDGLYGVDLLDPAFCGRLLADVDAFEATGLPVSRPNSMNRYGIVVDDVGFEPLITALQRSVLAPLAAALYEPAAGAGAGHPAAAFDAHHSFVVKYNADEGDSHLDMHTDDSDVTFNCCLGRETFEGSGLVFCGSIGDPGHRRHTQTYAHTIGRCVIHLGSRRHGADTITAGERCNLIVWNRSLAWREGPDATAYKSAYAPEAGLPDQRCVSYMHDRDFGNFRAYRPGTEAFRGEGWCPPTGAEYEGFREEDAPPPPPPPPPGAIGR